ncbi:hypothetical protein GCM10027030_01730 [Luteococcus sediminum]
MDHPLDFAARLREALVNSGLTLSRIRDQLAERELAVSLATLSYWSSGRSAPTRGRSVAVVEAPKEILGTPPGWLTSSLSHTVREHGLDRVFGREDFLREAIEEHGLATSVWWRHHTVHHIVTIGADRRERGFETRMLQTAARRGPALVHPAGERRHCQRPPGRPAEPADPHRAPGGRPDGLRVRPAGAAGARPEGAGGPQCRAGPLQTRAGHRLRPQAGGGGAVLEVHFEGQMPSAMQYELRVPGGDEDVEQPTQPVVSGQVAQFIIPEAAAGMHQLSWQW